jgi:hypothetical protein
LLGRRPGPRVGTLSLLVGRLELIDSLLQQPELVAQLLQFLGRRRRRLGKGRRC